MTQSQKLLLKKLSIPPAYLNQNFREITVKRGFSYFKNNYVLATQILSTTDLEGTNTSKIVIFSRVKGSKNKKYETQLMIDQKNKQASRITSQCNCPVQTNCKHGIATLFSYLNDLNITSSSITKGKTAKDIQINNWLEAMASTTQPAETFLEMVPKKEDYNYHLIYLLSLDDRENQFCIESVKARLLKKGGYGQTYQIQPYELNNQVYATPHDVDIIAGLSSLPEVGYYYENKFLLEGEIAELIFQKILKTNRLLWTDKKTKIPLKNGLERSVEFKWTKKNKAYRPSLVINPKINNLFIIEKMYYLDLINQEVGLLTHPEMTPEQVIIFSNAPPIPAQKIKEISQKLFKTLPEIDLPLPIKINIKTKEIKEIKPLVKLCLETDIIEDASIHKARLSFEYDGVEYQPKGDIDKQYAVFIKNDIRYKIYRDQATEQQALSQLEQCSFISGASFFPALTKYDLLLKPDADITEQVLAWDNFKTNQLPILEQEGWDIRIDEGFNLTIDYIDDWVAEIDESEGGDWFEMALGFELDGKKVNLLPLLIELLVKNPDTNQLHQTLNEKEHQLFRLSEHQWVKIPTARILTVLDTIIELYDTNSLNKDGNFEFSKHAALNYGLLLNDPQLEWKGAKELQALTQKINDFSGIENKSLPQNLNAELRDYQQEGYNWLKFLNEYQFSGVLADDMGLGKTVQALSLLLSEKEEGKAKHPSLVIAPTSLMSNWRQEIEKFTPDLSILILQGLDRKKNFEKMDNFDLILTTYPLMFRDEKIYEEKQFHYLILDEAQAIKNAKSKTSQVIYKLKANHRLCITGTPIENHLGELWSMFHFAMPGYLGTHERFNRLFRKPIEKEGDQMRGIQLRKRVTPFMLRRTKDLVATELPKKTEIIRTVPLSGKQRDLYETVRLAMDKKVRDEIQKKGLARSHIMILDALLKLRQVCCDPRLVKLTKAKKVKESAKLSLLMDMIPEMIDEGRKILLFSQFTSMLGIIEDELKKQKIKYSKLTGQTRKREEAINKFQKGDAKIFLISLKAGGVGLNLTAADTVIHYDPWWNPAVEQQATDRAYRIGQDKPVFVYKLLTEETVEEKILAMQAKKKALADSLYDGNSEQSKLAFGQDELKALLAPLK